MNTAVKGRFAPSPSGYMHMGNLLSMLLAWLDARALGGAMLFRMEDLDPARSEERFAQAAAADLKKLGLHWEEGYPAPDYCQSRRTELYEDAFQTLRNRGLVYPCWCSRAQRLAASAPHPGELQHDPGCRCARFSAAERESMLSSGRRPAWKIRVPDETFTVEDVHYGSFTQNLARDCGDFILRRSDGVFAYQLAVSLDDAAMGVTRVVRGRDLLSSAPRQVWLISLLGGVAPVYAHGPLLTADSHKLSKRLGSLNTQSLFSRHTPEALVGLLAYTAGLIDRPESVAAADLIPGFSWDKIPREDLAPPEALA